MLTHDRTGRWTELLRDAEHNIYVFGIPLWVLLAAGVLAAAIAVVLQPELLGFLPEVGEAVAEGIDLGTEGAIDEEIAAAENRLQTELAAKVNPLGGTKNCPWTAREVEEGLADMFEGRTPEPYAPDWYTSDFGPDPAIRGDIDGFSKADSFEREFGGSFENTSVDSLEQQLQAAGNGSRGFVAISNGTESHVFNVVNYGGEIFFVDGQSGEVMATGNGCFPSGYGANSKIWFLPTAGF